ncbi:unnamed protein product [Dovyalis caffra]|uniref:Uncharacterized protein n=1 Tax=Dovyalis caffra TaxID=77055 RepID=A0AAV1SFJ4_9ROSI|nr:unnamed protein product [Dovyalis caffra]
MMKDMKYMQRWGDVAPALLISRQRSRSSAPKLETIVEEGSGNFRAAGVPKRIDPREKKEVRRLD